MKEKVIILGAGESGIGAAILAKKLGYEVFVSDAGMIAPKFKEELNKHKINYEENGHSEDEILYEIESRGTTMTNEMRSLPIELQKVVEKEFTTWPPREIIENYFVVHENFDKDWKPVYM